MHSEELVELVQCCCTDCMYLFLQNEPECSFFTRNFYVLDDYTGSRDDKGLTGVFAVWFSKEEGWRKASLTERVLIELQAPHRCIKY